MATTYKDILITPFRGDANNNPYIRFSSGDATTNADMNVWFYATTNGTLSFEGSAGQLFSITNDLTGTIFSVNDISGIPSLEIDANGKISLAHFGGNVGIGTSNPQYKLDVAGDARITGNVILGDSSTDTITLNGSVISLGNNQSIDSGTLFVDATNNRVGIGTTAPTSNLHVIGTANITGIVEVGNTVNALDFNSTSDIKYKTDVKNIDDALNTICQLRGVSFTWKDSQKPSYGLIAQEVQNVIPEIVSNNKDSSSLLLNYDALVGHFVEAIKELKEKIDVLEKKCNKYTKISKKRAD